MCLNCLKIFIFGRTGRSPEIPIEPRVDGLLTNELRKLLLLRSENTLNPEKYIIPSLKCKLPALVIGGLFNITKILTRKGYVPIALVFSHSELL